MDRITREDLDYQKKIAKRRTLLEYDPSGIEYDTLEFGLMNGWPKDA